MKKLKAYKFWGLISIVYGIVFIIIDRIDFLLMKNYWSKGLTQAYSEPFELRIPNLVFSIALVLAGYLLLNKRKESWYLFNISFIGILLKYLFSFLLSPFAIGNFLHIYGIHFCVALFGLIFVNKRIFFTEVQIVIKRRTVTYLFFVLIASMVLFIYSFDKLFGNKEFREKHYYELISNSHLLEKCDVDTCHFAYEFMQIIDTLEEIESYSQIQVLQLDSNAKPIYGERILAYSFKILRDFYIYSDFGLLLKQIKENEFSYLGQSDTLLFTYYKNGLIESITELYYHLNGYDTMKYHYNYCKYGDTVCNSTNKEFDYNYTTILNNLNKPILTKQNKGIYNSGIVEYTYNSNGLLVELVKHNQKENNQKSVETFYYNEHGLLERKVNNIYKDNSNKLISKVLTVVVYE